ncbi:MAG: hypothetical protein ACREOV_09215 [Candidatus Dormibacteraceae bacterium]
MPKVFAVSLLALLLFCGTVVTACAPGNTSDICSASPIKTVGKVPRIQPSPSQSGITAYLQSGKTVYAKRTTRIVWFVANDAAGPTLQIVAGINVQGTHFSKTVPKTNVSGSDSVYDSRVVFSRPGCWGVAVTSGSTQGSFDLDVVAQPKKSA